MHFLWIGFILLVLVLIALDLLVFHRKDKVVTVRSALGWSAFWIALALLFNVAIFFMYREHWLGLGTEHTAMHPKGLNGTRAAILFFTGYLVEQSLSVDNLFVMAVIFNYFAIPPKYQHRVLFWGIVGVLVMRGVMIGVGAALISRFHWLLYVFGGILLITAYKMLFGGGEANPKNNPVLRIARKLFPVTDQYHGHHFAVRQSELSAAETAALSGPPAASTMSKPNGWVLTPLALALVVIETTDVIFAVDSIPAIFAITTDPFLVFTSNVCAVLGLRSLFFALAGILEKFEYLKVSLSLILALIGVKMLLNDWVESQLHHVHFYVLGMVALILAGGIVASVIATRRKKPSVPVQDSAFVGR